MFSVLPAFFSAFVLTALATPFSIPFIKRAGLMDDPKTHMHPAIIHKKPIPRGGGIPLFFGVVATGLFFLPITNVTIYLFVASFIALITGVLDDKYDISRYLRFGVNILCALIVVASGIDIAFITNPFGGILHIDAIRLSVTFFGTHSIPILADFLGLLWIVWVMNMLNWSKGVDGQMPGVVAISALAIGILSLRFPLTDSYSQIAAQLSFIIAGSSLGFLLFNFYPAKIFPGYGATAIYLLLSVVSILSGAKLATAILVMGVPMVDGAFTVVRRIASGKSPFLGDNRHLHHLLLNRGFGQRRIALSYWIVSAMLGGIALSLTSSEKAFAIFMLLVIVTGGLLFLHATLKKPKK